MKSRTASSSTCPSGALAPISKRKFSCMKENANAAFASRVLLEYWYTYVAAAMTRSGYHRFREVVRRAYMFGMLSVQSMIRTLFD